MSEQAAYYNRFGHLHEKEILGCAHPEFWTTDYDIQGPVYLEMKERVETQGAFINEYFSKEFPVLDLGCGFGRQAFWLARQGFTVMGTDSSSVFIDIARKLFTLHQLEGAFQCVRLSAFQPEVAYKQVILFDVLEHIPPVKRRTVLKQISGLMEKDGILIVSLPHLKSRFSSFINNQIVKRVSGLFSYFRNRQEHPFMIPGKTQLRSLSAPYFTMMEFKVTPKTDYYIFRKI